MTRKPRIQFAGALHHVGYPAADEGWRKAVAEEHGELLAAQTPGGEEMNELKEALWARALERLLEKAGKTRAEAPDDWCGAEWDMKFAIESRHTTTATNDWIAQELSMGTTGGSVSVFVSRWRSK